jgi:crotonobetainyl-CoA:carnitine CoA-transferase CaiB-like acyl-CoA transferase
MSPVYSIAQIEQDPQMIAREAIVPVPDDDFGIVRMQNVVPKFLKDPGTVRSSGGAAGRDNELVYGEWLGMSAADLSRLRESRVV